MRAAATIALISLATLAGACGPDRDLSAVQAGLLIPRALADDLVSVDLYIFEIKNEVPTVQELLEESQEFPGTFDGYKKYRPFKKVTLTFDAGLEATIKGIPVRGSWIFYARGYARDNVLICIGATGPATFKTDEQTIITIELNATTP